MIFFQTGDVLCLKKKHYLYQCSVLYDNIGIIYKDNEDIYFIYCPNPYQLSIRIIPIDQLPTDKYYINVYKITRNIQHEFDDIISFIKGEMVPSKDWLYSQLHPLFVSNYYTHWSSMLLYIILYNTTHELDKINEYNIYLELPPEQCLHIFLKPFLLDI